MSIGRGLVSAFTLAALAGAATGGIQFTEQSITRFPTDPQLYSNQATIGDIDGDGDLDIIFANGGNFGSQGPPQPAQLLINDGTGFFTDGTGTQLNAMGNYRGVELGDVDNDGDLDVLFSNDFNQRPGLHLNDGSGNFTAAPGNIPGEQLSAARAQFGDIDNDGDLDVYILDGGTSRFGCGQNKIWINDGTGMFTDQTATYHPIGNLCEPMDVIFGDVDGDFDLDVRTGSTGSSQSRLYINDGTGVMTAKSTPGDTNTYSYDFGDIDNDGDLDIFGENSGPGNTGLLLKNDGNGNFSNANSQILSNPNLDDNDSKFFDYDNDGDNDIIIARLGGPERILTNNGAGIFSATSGVIQTVTNSALDVMVADLTGDGRIDVITAVGESGNFRNRFYVNVDGPVDSIAPSILTEQVASEGGSQVVVRADIADGMSSDRGAFLSDVTLMYGLNGDLSNSAPMMWSGNQIYRGVIDVPGCGGEVSYQVVATDFAGNTGEGDVLTFTASGSGGLPADLDGSGTVDSADLNMLLAEFGCSGTGSCLSIDGDDDTDSADLNILLASFGQSCGG